MRYIISIFFTLFVSLLGIAQSINSSKSEVTFEIGNLVFNTVEGKFKKMTGEVIFKASDLSAARFDVCVDASTIDTGSRKRDDHLRNEDFFDVKQYPKICFQSNTISKKGKNYLAKGKLTMHGITKKVEIPFSYSNKTLKGSLTVNRYDYNIGLSTSKFMVSKETEIEIICVID